MNVISKPKCGSRRTRRTTMMAFVAVIAVLAACGDSESSDDVCDEFAQAQILPSERPVCLNYDPTTVGTVVTRPVLLQSRGMMDLIISGEPQLRIEGDVRGHFILDGIDLTTVTCPEAAAVGIRYAPTAPGWDTATLFIESNAQNFQSLDIFFLALAVPADDPSYDPGPKPANAVGADGSETCPPR